MRAAAGFLTGVLLATGMTLPALADDGTGETAQPAALVGEWRVDLRPTPDADPYYQTLTITSATDKGVKGTFYGTPFTEGCLNDDWGTVHVAFITQDGSGPYAHSARLVDGRLEGLSHSTGRDFLAVWTAERADASGSSRD